MHMRAHTYTCTYTWRWCLAWRWREMNSQHRGMPPSTDRRSSEEKTRKSHCQRLFSPHCAGKSGISFVTYGFLVWAAQRFYYLEREQYSACELLHEEIYCGREKQEGGAWLSSCQSWSYVQLAKRKSFFVVLKVLHHNWTLWAVKHRTNLALQFFLIPPSEVGSVLLESGGLMATSQSAEGMC